MSVRAPAMALPSPSNAEPAVILERLGFAYGGAPLFEDLSLALPSGSWTCLLGPSGVGKSSLLRILAGLETPSCGRVIVPGNGIQPASHCAYLGQRDALFPWLSVLDNAAVGHALRGGYRAAARMRPRAAALLSEVGLADALDQRPDSLSGGMRQRVALVRTLLEDRPIVLLDEPFSALDAITRLAMQDLSCRLLAGRTVLLVTHDPMEALRLGDQVLVMTGRPAHLSAPLRLPPRPAGNPRPVDDPALLHMQGELLARLAAGALP